MLKSGRGRYTFSMLSETANTHSFPRLAVSDDKLRRIIWQGGLIFYVLPVSENAEVVSLSVPKN